MENVFFYVSWAILPLAWIIFTLKGIRTYFRMNMRPLNKIIGAVIYIALLVSFAFLGNAIFGALNIL